MRCSSRAVSGLIATAGCTAAAMAQCIPTWTAYSGPPLDGPIRAVTVWDPDGPGPAQPVVVAGGNFRRVGAASLNHVGLWNGSAWSQMGSAVNGIVRIATVFGPNGSGSALPQPVIGGDFTLSGATALNYIARFDGSQWLPLGAGVDPMYSEVFSAAAFNGSLIVGGAFLSAGGVPVQGIARWDGAAWYALPDERAWAPDVLTVLAGVLHAGGFFAPPSPRPGVLRWDGASWNTIGQNYPQNDVYALAMYHGELYAGGVFCNCGSPPPEPGAFIVRYDGTSWVTVGANQGMDGPVFALCVFDPDGDGPMPELLFAGGAFGTAGGVPASGIAAWDGAAWSALGQGTSDRVRALTIWNHQLVAAGDFYMAGGLVSPGMAFWGCPQPPSCYANCDQSTTPPILNVSDFACFLNAFVSGSPYANCDNSTTAPVLNIHDFLCFINKFAAGCS